MHTYDGDILLVQDDFSSDDSEKEMGNNVMDAFDPGCEKGTCYCNIQPTVRDGGAGGAGGALTPPLLRRMTFYFVLVYVVIRENT